MSTHAAGLWAVFALAALSGACAREHGNDPSPGDAPGTTGDDVDRGTTSTANEPARIGAKAVATLESVAITAPDKGDLLVGTATFAETAASVDMTLTMRGCTVRRAYPVFVLDAADCSDNALLEAQVHASRNEDAPLVTCTTASTLGRAFYSHPNSAKKPWSIGTPQSTNLLGRVLVVTDPDTLQPLACGAITRTEDVAPVTEPMSANAASVDARAVLAGICVSKKFVPDNRSTCPNPTELTRCASAHCELDPCVQQCTEFLSCLDRNADPCTAEFECDISDACSDCRLRINSCMFGFCAEQIACAPAVTPDGPCSKLEACCAMQGDGAAACLETVRLLEKFSGDQSCRGVMKDWDVTAHLSVPCRFQ